MRFIAILLLWAALSAAQSSTAGSAVTRPRITGLAHVALVAHDFDASRAFYSKFLGYQEVFTLPKSDGSVGMAFFKINDRQYIELSPETEAGTDRLKHVALETDNAEQMRLYLQSKGVAVPSATPKGLIGNSNFTMKDPAGHSIEIVQYEPNGWSAKNFGKAITDARISTHMRHAGLIVTALEPERKFYTDVLGFQEIWRGSKDGKQLSWTNMKVPDGTDYLEFMLFGEEPAPDKRGGSHHICLEVPDIEAAAQKLAKTAYSKEYPKKLDIKTGVNRKRQLNLFDPDGTRSELMEPGTVDGKAAPVSSAPPPGD